MVTEIVWTERSKEDFKDIVHFLMKDSDILAENWVYKLEHDLELLKKFPEMGKMNLEKEVSFIREIFVGKYRVVYSYLENKITILLIRHINRPLGKI